jgi:hypothetical protein
MCSTTLRNLDLKIPYILWLTKMIKSDRIWRFKILHCSLLYMSKKNLFCAAQNTGYFNIFLFSRVHYFLHLDIFSFKLFETLKRCF